jgi:alpha-N-arabinofuranosidase
MKLAFALLAIISLLIGSGCASNRPSAEAPISRGAPGRLTVEVNHPGAKISPMLYGLMTEEINHSYDGGLYAELIQNRIFQDDDIRPVHWSLVKSDGAAGAIALDEHDPVNTTALTRSLRLDIDSVGNGQRVGVANEGYWGIPVLPNTQYHASFYARGGGGLTGPLIVDIESNDGQIVYTSASVDQIDAEWKKYDVTLATGDLKPLADARFVISTSGTGSLWLSLVSLFPPTFNNRPNGNRIDLMQMLGDMQPAFLRLPGGNYLEGDTIDTRFAWKNTIGDVSDRPGHQGPWRYRSSDGLGLLEFLEWCQDLRMEPVLAVFAGYALRGAHVDAGPDLQPYVQEALDEIEYCTGDASTKWGHERAINGHPDPFKIEYVEIGNEDWFDRAHTYDARFAQFYDAIKAKYPNLQLIATAPIQSRRPDVLDEHFYRSTRQMERDTHHYDTYDRNGPKIFVGEWATREGIPTPNLGAAISDAAWLTGLERNSDLVVLSSYAPLLVNVNPGGSQWSTNLIGYDALSSFGSPSYYAQKMFNKNRGDTVLPVEIKEQPHESPPPPPPAGAIGVGTFETSAMFKDIKVTQGDTVLYQCDFSNGITGWRPSRDSQWTVQDGAVTQTTMIQDTRLTTGDRTWGDYTYTLKAGKLSGNEGFIVMFHVQDRNNFLIWNIGGWGNDHSAIEQITDGIKTDLGQPAPVTVEASRWYSVRIELKGRDIKCYLDGQLITEATDTPGPPPPAVFATASRIDKTGQVILKVVNGSATPQSLRINLDGAGDVARDASVTVLSGQPKDQNTVDQPTKIVPQEVDLHDAGSSFLHEFPGYSVSVLKFSMK